MVLLKMMNASHTDRPPRKKTKVDGQSLLDDNTEEGADDIPACNSCRRRKTKCSRESPCSQCTRLQIDCVYGDSRERPGIKPGTIQMLTQRISDLEQMVLGQGLLLEPLLQRATGQGAAAQSSFNDQTQALKQKYLAAVRSPPSTVPSSEPVESCTISTSRSGLTVNSALSNFSNRCKDLLPPEDRLQSMIDIYFAQLHPWIPVLHEKSFRQKVADTTYASQLAPILLAITSVCLRLDHNTTMLDQEKHTWSLECRNAVVLQGMDKFSVENLQALVIIAFDMVRKSQPYMDTC